MEEKTNERTMEGHEEKLMGYAARLNDVIVDMLEDHCSAVEIVGIVEFAKGRLMHESLMVDSLSRAEEWLDGLFEDEEE